MITVSLYLDFYGLVDVDVWEPAYQMGRGLHALQDSFAHTVRSDDLTKIRHVLNYVDAIEGHLQERRDGLPHSVHMDRCDGDTEPIAMQSHNASVDYVKAINLAIQANGTEPILSVLDKWVSHESGCTIENDYCASIWVSIARMDPTGPYLEEFLGCATVSNSSASGLFALIILMALMCLKRRWYKTAATVMVLCICLPSPGQAQGFVRAESHASVLSDAPERSVLASTFGVGVRGGYTWGQWRGLAHLERNYWLSTELADRMKAGALNLGFGVEYLSHRDSSVPALFWALPRSCSIHSSTRGALRVSSLTCVRSNCVGCPWIAWGSPSPRSVLPMCRLCSIIHPFEWSFIERFLGLEGQF